MSGSSEKLPTPFDDGEVYDLILKDIPYGFDFYTGLAKEAKGPVLDVCCGTGRILADTDLVRFWRQDLGS